MYKFTGERERDVLPPINNKEIREITEFKLMKMQNQLNSAERSKSLKNIYSSRLDKKQWKGDVILEGYKNRSEHTRSIIELENEIRNKELKIETDNNKNRYKNSGIHIRNFKWLGRINDSKLNDKEVRVYDNKFYKDDKQN